MKIHFSPYTLAAAAVLSFASGCAAYSEDSLDSTAENSAGKPGLEEVEVPLSEEQAERVMFIPGEAVVVFSEDMCNRIEANVQTKGEAVEMVEFDKLREEIGFKSMERLFPHAGEFEPRTRERGLHRYYIVSFDGSVSLSKAKMVFEDIEGCQSFERQHRVSSKLTVNDSDFSRLWGLKTGSYGINVEQVWDYTMGKPNVKVCVVDQGIQLDHPDLSWNCSQTDNYNFVNNNSTINPGDHGTHVAGTIAAVGNNSEGIVGIAGGNWKKKEKGVTLISAQVFDGESSASSFARAVKWGADHGAIISQNSWGYDFDYNKDGKLTGNELSNALNAQIDASLRDAVDYFILYAGCDNAGNQLTDSPMKGGLVVFAAGNDGIANGAPANYGPIVSVGATTSTGTVASFSNYGQWVDICAPGYSIYSTLVGDKYGSLSGTSMACPHVSGAAALLASFFGRPGFTAEDLEEMLICGAHPSLIRYGDKICGPYLDVWSSFLYAMKNMDRGYNNAPEIKTDYTGDFVFRQWENIDIPFTFSDPDKDSYTIETEIEGRAKFIKDSEVDSIYHFTLLCELVKDFAPQRVSITAKDIFDADSTVVFYYQVLENRPPEPSGEIDGILLNPSVKEASLDISTLFTDPDDEPLKYSAKVSPKDILKLDVNGSNLTVTALQGGMATVTVTASDYMGKKAEYSFKVLYRDKDTSVDIYPNPVVDYLNIRTGATAEEADVILTSSNGKTVFSGKISCSAFNPGKIDMRDCAPGQYKISVTLNGEKTENTIMKI